MSVSAPVPSGPVQRVRATIAYDGTAFHGFAENLGVRTVAGELITAITQWLRAPDRVALSCAGRTDKGVHARAQVVSFDVPVGCDLAELTLRLNRRLAPEISVRDVRGVSDRFDARFSARARHYEYLVFNRPEPDPFWFRRAWHVPAPLSLAQLRLACDPFIGEHDFASFCRAAHASDGTARSLVRRVHAARWSQLDDDLLRFEIVASSFCHQMVRSVVGTMVEVGLGRRYAGELVGIIRARSRDAAGDVAPPDGLYLVHVDYPDDPPPSRTS